MLKEGSKGPGVMAWMVTSLMAADTRFRPSKGVDIRRNVEDGHVSVFIWTGPHF